jgi:hypothetical protein
MAKNIEMASAAWHHRNGVKMKIISVMAAQRNNEKWRGVAAASEAWHQRNIGG